MPTRLAALAAASLLWLSAGCAGPRAPAGAGTRPDSGTAHPLASPGASGPPTGSAATPAAPAAPGPAAARCPGDMLRLPSGRASLDGRSVAVGEACLDVTEVTVAAYERCVAEGACRPAFQTGEWPGISPAMRTASGRQCNQGKPGRALHPVNCVTAEQAARYCAWRGARLPAEEEFVWAARGTGRGSRFPWGDAEPAGRACWAGRGTSAVAGVEASTCPVGSHPTGDSPQGLKDLAGNVYEWLRAADGRAVARGGSFVDILPGVLAAGEHAWASPPERSGAIGFRCAAAPR